jgi:hypothetical protein
VPPLAELFDPVVAEPDPLPPPLELVPLLELVAVPQVPVAEPPRASVPLPHKLTGASRPRKPPRPLLVEPTCAPLAPWVEEVPHVADELPPAAVVPLPHTVTGALAPIEPPLADVLWFIAPGLPQVVDPSPPTALRLLPHTVIGAFTPMLEASVLDDPSGGMVTPAAGVPAVVPQSDGPA